MCSEDEEMIGWLARAKAGHDKDALYIIIEEKGDYVWLADGVYKTLAKPKKKNKKHIQIYKKQTQETAALQSKLLEGQPVRDEEIKRALKLVVKNEMEEENV